MIVATWQCDSGACCSRHVRQMLALGRRTSLASNPAPARLIAKISLSLDVDTPFWGICMNARAREGVYTPPSMSVMSALSLGWRSTAARMLCSCSRAAPSARPA